MNYIHPNDRLEIFKKEKRPLLNSEVWRKLGLESVYDFEMISVPEEELKEEVKIYIWVKTGSTSYARREEPYLFHPDMLEEFWLNETLYILKTTNDEVDLETIIKELGIQIVNYYGLTDPLGKSFDLTSDAGLGEEKNKRLLRFLNQHNDKFYVRQGKMQLGVPKGSLADLISAETYIVGLVEWKDKVLKRDRKIIMNEIIKVLRNSQRKMLSIKDLTYSINRTKLDTLTPKPFDVELIRSIVKENRGRVIYSMFNEEPVTLLDDLDYITNYFKKVRQPYNKFIFSKESSGLLAYIFIGNKFPFQEAIEYIKTRPIIFVDEILFMTQKNLIVHQELREYLEILLGASNYESIDSWLNENVVLSYYEENSSQIKLLTPQIIEKFSPIFNVDKNPGNLFQYTLKSKVEEYYKKNPNKKFSF